jgi:hypothetical protein
VERRDGAAACRSTISLPIWSVLSRCAGALSRALIAGYSASIQTLAEEAIRLGRDDLRMAVVLANPSVAAAPA